jgi:hypothetical protein
MKASQIPWEKYIIPAGVVVGGYFLLKKFNLFGDSGTTINNDQTAAQTTAAVDKSLADAKKAGDFATLTDSQAAGIANAIYTAGINDDAYTARQQIIQVNTLTDLLKVIKAFGTKQAAESKWSTCYTLGFGCNAYNLAGFLHLPFMDQQNLNIINNYLSAQGINYNF